MKRLIAALIISGAFTVPTAAQATECNPLTEPCELPPPECNPLTEPCELPPPECNPLTEPCELPDDQPEGRKVGHIKHAARFASR